MAIKLGAENKRNVIVAIALFAVVIFLVIRQLIGSDAPSGASRTAAIPAAEMAATPAPASVPAISASSQPASSAIGPAAKQIAGLGLDPALHLEKLEATESIEYSGEERNIFSADSAPVKIEKPMAPARPVLTTVAMPTGPPPIPQPPQIDLKFYGYSSAKGGQREAFLMRGEDIFVAKPGEIVDHRFKVVAINVGPAQTTVQVTDLSYNNTQTLPLALN